MRGCIDTSCLSAWSHPVFHLLLLTLWVFMCPLSVLSVVVCYSPSVACLFINQDTLYEWRASRFILKNGLVVHVWMCHDFLKSVSCWWTLVLLEVCCEVVLRWLPSYLCSSLCVHDLCSSLCVHAGAHVCSCDVPGVEDMGAGYPPVAVMRLDSFNPTNSRDAYLQACRPLGPYLLRQSGNLCSEHLKIYLRSTCSTF